MEADDSASDRPYSHSRSPRSPRSRRESPSSNADELGRRAQLSDRSSARRSRPRKSRERSSEDRRKHTPNSQTNADAVDSKPTPTSAPSSKLHHTRHGKRRSRGREENTDLYIETPVTRVLREVPDDILDTPQNSLSRDQQHAYHGDGDNVYRVQKKRDCVYVEHYDGFSSVPRHNALVNPGSTLNNGWFNFSASTALDIAISVQKSWIPLTDFSHGLLAGVALMQTILVDRLFGSSSEELSQFLSFYSNFSLIFTTMFLLLASVCLVSVFDRLDLARGEWPYLTDLLSVRPRIPWLLIPIYVGGLILSLAAAKGDDFIHTCQYNNSNFTLVKADMDLLSSWHVLNSLRCTCVVIGWLFISASHPPDLLLNLLVDLLPLQNADSKTAHGADQSTAH